MSVDRLREVGVSFSEILIAPLAVDPQEEAELSALDRQIYKQFSKEQEMSEGVEILFSDMQEECCSEDRELKLEQNSEYAGTHDQFN